jgi:hypothetical protein
VRCSGEFDVKTLHFELLSPPQCSACPQCGSVGADAAVGTASADTRTAQTGPERNSSREWNSNLVCRYFMPHAKILKSKERCSGHKGTISTWTLTLSDGSVTYDACFQPIDEYKTKAGFANGRVEFDFKDSWKFNIAGYRIAKMISLDYMVPVYTERKWNGQQGSMAWWVPNVMFDEADRVKKREQPPDVDAFNKQMYRIRVTTQLFYDTDTNLTNVLIY